MAKEWSTNEIRKVYLDFFHDKGHKVVPSDSLIPQGDPTLLFTGAGMNQFKEYFLGLKHDMTRATSSQKCLRTGDLDNVGRTPYHHSFFEMLGNFSFGDYFKREAIEWAMELLTEYFSVPRDRIRVSVHQHDEEAYKIWRDNVRIPEAWVKRLGDHSNFWPANAIKDGPNGPCGPCSEIFYDQGPECGCGRPTCDVQCDCGRFAEIWNLVFTQYDRHEGGKLVPLAAKHIDTGAGLERLSCVLQQKTNNFDIDILKPLVDFLAKNAEGVSIARSPDCLQVARTIVDHGRAATFAIADGVTPSNEGRGYVVRKLIRRALWQGKQFLFSRKASKPFIFGLVSLVVEVMAEPYPYLQKVLEPVEMIIRGEEERFLATLEDGQRILDEMIHSTKQKGKKVISSEDAFRLYDTYGFPDELTVTIAKEHGLEIDLKGFEQLMEEQRKRAKDASKITDSIFVAAHVNPKLTQLPPSKFLGYETLQAEGKILFLDLKGKEGWAILDQTPFYAEKGGQVGDKGIWRWQGGHAGVMDTQWKDNKWILHQLQIEAGNLTENMTVQAQVDEHLRERTRRHHTATHILQSALRQVLGPHVRQLGSLVSPEKLRFDFSHPKPLSYKETKEIENSVNFAILSNLPVSTEIKTFDQSQKDGALAFFGEKYDARVRILNVGNGFSKELCGGTHVKQTGDIGSFLITSESSIASGTRRIEAVAGMVAVEYMQKTKEQLEKLASMLKASPAELFERVEKLQDKLRGQQKNVPPQISREELTAVIQSGFEIRGVRFMHHEFKDLDIGSLRGVTDQIRAMTQGKQSVVVLFSTAEAAVNFVTASNSNLVDAARLTKKIASLLNGSGGGKKDFAQGGSKRSDLVSSVKSQMKDLFTDIFQE